MDFQIFLNVSSENEEIRTNAVQIIERAEEDPSFVSFLVNSLQTPESQKNPRLQKMLLIVLYDITKRRFSHIILAAKDPQFTQTLLNLLFTLPFEDRNIIEDCIIEIALTSPNDFSSIIHMVIQSINTDSQISQICTAMSLSLKWVNQSSDSTFMTNIGTVLVPILNKVVSQSNDPHTPKTISIISKLTCSLLTRRNLILDSSFDQIILGFNTFLTVNVSNESINEMKISILDTFVELLNCAYDKWKSIEEISSWREHFSKDILPPIVATSYQLLNLPLDDVLFGKIFQIFYVFLSFGISLDHLLTQNFFPAVIRAAKLTASDLQDFEVNPCNFISFCCEHEVLEFYSPRLCSSKFLQIILEKYRDRFDPLPLLVQPSTNPIEFEAQIYLLQRYTKMSDIPDDIFEAFFNLLTQEQPLYIVTSLLYFITGPMSRNYNIVGISVAEHFIINSENIIIQYAGVLLMNSCLEEFSNKLHELNDIVEINTSAIFPALLNLSSKIFLPEPVELMEKLFQIGGASFLNIVTQLIESFFQLWSINQSTTDDSQSLINSSLMNNIVTILEMIPFNSPLMINLAPMILTQLMKDITEYPDNLTLTEQIRIAGVFSHKVSPPLEVQFMFLTFILNLNTDPSLLSTNLVILLCPLILSSINIIKNLGILPQIMQLCNILLQNEQDPETITQGLIICSCLIQSENGIEFFPFVTTALQILINKPKIIILFGVLYVLSAAFCVNFDDAITLINVEIVNLICHMLREKDVVMSYREIKLAVFVLVKFANLGNNEAYEIAASLFRQLFEMEKLDKKIGVINGDNMLDLENLHRNENVISLAPYVLMPLDNIDEMKEFMQVTEKNGLLGTLENGINDIVNAFIQ